MTIRLRRSELATPASNPEMIRHAGASDADLVILDLEDSPVVGWAGARLLDVQQPFADAVIIEAAMPTQLMVLVVADRFGLDTELAALAALVTTTASFATLLLVHHLLPGSGTRLQRRGAESRSPEGEAAFLGCRSISSGRAGLAPPL